jgi:DNA-binding MarR family transcriptional regulator
VMQILVMAVQNAVAYEQLGVATSGTTLFRSIGGSVGSALFGAIFAYTLSEAIRVQAPQLTGTMSDPAAISALSGPLKATYDAIFVASLHPVFRTAAGLAFVAFLLAFTIREVPLRTTLAAEPQNDPLQMPRDATSLEELERIVDRISSKENRWRFYEQAAKRNDLDLQPDEFWLLARIGESGGRASKEELRKKLGPKETRQPKIFGRLEAAGMAREASATTVELTEKGQAIYARLVRQREENLAHMLADWDRNEHPEVRAVMKELAMSFASSPPIKPGLTPSASPAH